MIKSERRIRQDADPGLWALNVDMDIENQSVLIILLSLGIFLCSHYHFRHIFWKVISPELKSKDSSSNSSYLQHVSYYLNDLSFSLYRCYPGHLNFARKTAKVNNLLHFLKASYIIIISNQFLEKIRYSHYTFTRVISIEKAHNGYQVWARMQSC